MRGINTRPARGSRGLAASAPAPGRRDEAGVTLIAPETVFLSADTRLGRDVTIEPYVVFGPGVAVEEGATSARSRISTARTSAGTHRRTLCAAAPRREARKRTCISAISSRSRRR